MPTRGLLQAKWRVVKLVEKVRRSSPFTETTLKTGSLCTVNYYLLECEHVISIKFTLEPGAITH